MPLTCILCKKRLKKLQARPVNKQIARYLRKTFLLECTNTDYICGKCSRPVYRPDRPIPATCTTHSAQHPADNNATTLPVSPPSVCLRLPTTSRSHAYCFMCKRPGPKLVVIPQSTRFDMFLKHNVLVSAGSRCCPVHLDNNGEFHLSAISHLKTIDHVFLNRTSIIDLLQKLRLTIHSLSAKKISFDDLDSYSDQDTYNLTGLNKQQFLDLYCSIHNQIRNTPARSAITTLGIFLMKMRTGLSDKLLATLFSVSKASIRRGIHTVRKILLSDFVPQHLGFNHLSRESVIENHTTVLSKSLFTDNHDQVILVLDGTYIYIQKSNNFHFQRRSYSLHKGRPLVKPMVIVTTTGYFLSVLGPYFADYKNNDASIIKHIMASNIENIRQWIHPSDIFIVDRGFRDSIDFLEDLGIHTEMPVFMQKGEKQMSTEDANTSRLVTKVRWVVEAANGKIKTWKYLGHTLPTNQIPYIGDYVRIVCALMNKYSQPVTVDAETDRELAVRMKTMSSSINDLKTEVESRFNGRSSSDWITATEEVLSDFPVMTEENLRNLTCGSYQLKLSTSYIQESFGGYHDIKIHKKEDRLIRVKLQSRHISSKVYLVWIKYMPSSVVSWYCRCRAGARVVGVCSHVAAVLWYLCHARHSQKNSFGVKDWGGYLEDAAIYPTLIDDSSDSDEESVVEE